MVPSRKVIFILSLLGAGLIMLFPYWLQAQEQKLIEIDSMWQNYAQQTDDSTRLTLLCQIASKYLSTSKRDTAFAVARHALEEATELEMLNVQATAHISLGEAHDVMGQLEAALEEFSYAEALGKKTGNGKVLVRVYNSQGLAYYYHGRMEESIKSYEQALVYARENSNKRQESMVLQNLANGYAKVSRYFEALNAHLDARNIKDSLFLAGDSTLTNRERISNYINLGAFYQEIKQFADASEHYLKALAITPESEHELRFVIIFNLGAIEERQENFAEAEQYYADGLELLLKDQIIRRQAGTYIPLGVVSLEQNRLEQAGEYFEKAARILEQVPNPIYRSDLLTGQAEWHLREYRFTEAISNAEEGLRLAQANSYPRGQADAHKILAEIAEQTQNWPAAATHLREYVTWRDSLDSEDRRLELVGVQAVKDVQLSKERHKAAMAEQKAAHAEYTNRILSIAVTLTSLLSLALAFFVYRQIITNRKLNVANEQLNEANLQLHSSNQQLNLANNKLQQFAFATGHDLKESLRSITSFTQLASIEMLQDANLAQQHLKEASAGGKRMRKLLDDLLQVANLSVNDSVEANIPLQEVIASVKSQLKEDIIDTQGDVRLVTPATLKANRNAVEQLFFNLVHNAIQYARPAHPPRITIAAEKRGDEVTFIVEDNASGIPAAERESIFDAFHRLHDRHKSGSGLGLAICKRIVEEHGGSIWHEERPDGQAGSRFVFTLPQANPKALAGTI